MSYDRKKLRGELIHDEGKVSHAYADSEGYLTIGVGHLIDKRKGGGLSDAAIDFILDEDIDRFEAALDEKLPWWRQLDDVRQRVLLNMAFNLGINGLLTFRNTLAAVQRGDYALAAKGMLRSKWGSQVGIRANRLAAKMAGTET